MAYRWLPAFLLSGLACAQAPAPDDPLWQYPAVTGMHSPVNPDCDMRVTVPGAKFCLRPAVKPGFWLKGDDILHSGNVAEWSRSTSQPDLFLRPTMVPKRIAGLPVVKFEDNAELVTNEGPDFGTRRFTIFVVGRKIPGTEYAGIFGHSHDPQYGALYWAGSNGLVLHVQSASPIDWRYDAAEEFHLVALRCDFATVSAFLNGEPLETRTLTPSITGYPVNRGVAFTHVGRYGGAPPATAADRMKAKRGPLRGGEFAEIIYYRRTLSDEEFVETTRYLIKKYSLPVPGRKADVAEKAVVPAQVFTFPADDAAAEQAAARLPVMLGFNSPAAKQCNYSAAPGQSDYCLRPADGVHAWLRGDDVWTRTTLMKLWKSPPFVGNDALAGEEPGTGAWLLPNTLATFPVARIAERASLRFKSPLSAKEFTLFVVGRQTPGSFSGQILSSDPAHDQGISWHDGKLLRIRGGAAAIADFEDPGATDFHVVAVQYRDGAIVAYAGAREGQAQQQALPSGMRFDFVGVPSRTASGDTGARAMFGGLQLRAPANPAQGADIAELLLWPRALDSSEMTATRRYLRRKYSLP
jgi:hypothetical protein